MAKRNRVSKAAILEAATDLTKAKGAQALTVDAVAKAAGCAKGSVHYHYKSKTGLLEAVAQEVTELRTARWESAFEAESPRGAIDRSWSILTDESRDGTIRAWMSLFASGSPVTDQAANAGVRRFSQGLGAATVRFLERIGRQPTVPVDEIGWLMGAVVHGMGLQLAGGGPAADLEGAYAAAWLGILALTRPPTQ